MNTNTVHVTEAGSLPGLRRLRTMRYWGVGILCCGMMISTLLGQSLLEATRDLKLAVTARPGLGEAGSRSDRILVMPKSKMSLRRLHSTLGTKVLETFPAIGSLQIVSVPENLTVEAAIAAYNQSGQVEFAERDYLVELPRSTATSNNKVNPLMGSNGVGFYPWGGGADVKAAESLRKLNPASKIVIAIIDTGIHSSDEALTGKIWTNLDEIADNVEDDDGDGYVDNIHGINAINNSGDSGDDHSHGTRVAKTIVALSDSCLRAAGINSQVQLMACKFLDSKGKGSISDAIKCIDYARFRGVNVITTSWGTENLASKALQAAIGTTRDAGIVFVGVAGN